MEHNSTSGRGWASTTGAIPIHHMCIDDGDGAGSSNGSDNDDNSIILSSSSSYQGRSTKQTNEEIIQCRVVCVKINHDLEGLRERDICQGNATKVLSQNFGAAKHFVPKNLEGGPSQTSTPT